MSAPRKITVGFGCKVETNDTMNELDGSGNFSLPRSELSIMNKAIGRIDAKFKTEESDFDAAADAVARLGNIMNAPHTKSMAFNGLCPLKPVTSAQQDQSFADDGSVSSTRESDRKRKARPDIDTSLDGDNTVNSKGKKKQLTIERREERNSREKERSLKITEQIHELRNLLSSGGIIVPKGTKSTILTEAASYIRLLQQHHYRSEMDKAQLIQEVQRIGKGEIGQKAAAAIRHVAAQNGVYNTVGNFGEIPTSGGAGVGEVERDLSSLNEGALPEMIQELDYRFVFNSCSVGMAIATMGGSFIDCNQAFTQLSSYTKLELCAMTIFNLTSRDDLQGAFDMMSRLISPKISAGIEAGDNVQENKGQAPVTLRSSIKERNDLGLSVSLVRGDDGIAKYFSVTLVKITSAPVDPSRQTIPTTADLATDVASQPSLAPQPTLKTAISQSMDKQSFQGLFGPAYTAG